MFRKEFRSLAPLFAHINKRGAGCEWFVVIAAYVDESGTHERAPVLCVAITVATDKNWEAFENGWRPLVQRLPNGYHAKRHPRLAMPLAELMVKNVPFASYITIDVKLFNKIVPSWVRGTLGGPYRFGVNQSLLSVARWARQQRAERVSYFVEQGHKEFPFVMTMLDHISQGPALRERYHMETWGPATKSDLPAHCSDTIAHEAAMNYGTGLHCPFIGRLKSGDVLSVGTVSPEVIEEYAQRAKEVVRHYQRAKAEARWLLKQAKKALEK